MQTIRADAETLMRQAPATIDVYLDAVVERLDAKFGRDYARDHSELVGAMITACAIDLATSCICSVLQNSTSSVLDFVERMSD